MEKIVQMQEMQSKIDSLSLKEAIAAVKEAEMEIVRLKESHQSAQQEIQRAKLEIEKKDRKSEVKDAYSDKMFWDNKYSSGNKNTRTSNQKKIDKFARPSNYEWYLDFYEMKTFLVSDLQETINLNSFQSTKTHHRCLVAGCGNSSLCEDLIKTSLKFHQIIGVDYSETVIAQMKSRISTLGDTQKANSSSSSHNHSNHNNNIITNPFTSLSYVHCDLTSHSGFSDGHFTVIIDKGTLDAISSDTDNTCKLSNQTDKVPAYSKYINEICRLLAMDGKYVLITTMPPEILVQIFTGTSADICFRVPLSLPPPPPPSTNKTSETKNSLHENGDGYHMRKGSVLPVNHCPPSSLLDLYSSLCYCHREILNSVQMKVHYYALEKYFGVCDRDTILSTGDTTTGISYSEIRDEGHLSTGDHTTVSAASNSNKSHSNTSNISISDEDHHLNHKGENVGSNTPNILDSWLKYAEEILRDTMMSIPESVVHGGEASNSDKSTSTETMFTEASTNPSFYKSSSSDVIIEEVLLQERIASSTLMTELRLNKVKIRCYDQQEEQKGEVKEANQVKGNAAEKQKMNSDVKSILSSNHCYWGGKTLWIEYELLSIESWDEDDYICLSVSLPSIPLDKSHKEEEANTTTTSTTTTSTTNPNSHYECFEYTVPLTAATITTKMKSAKKSIRYIGGQPLALPLYSGLFHISYFRTITTTTNDASPPGTSRRILKRHIELGRTPTFSILIPCWNHSPVIPFIGSRGGLSLRSGSIALTNKQFQQQQQQANNSEGNLNKGIRNDSNHSTRNSHFLFVLEYLKGTKVICITATTMNESELSVEISQSENKLITNPIISRANMWIYDKNVVNKKDGSNGSYPNWTVVIEADVISSTPDSRTTTVTYIEEVSIPIAWMNSFTHQNTLAMNTFTTTMNHNQIQSSSNYPSLALEGSQCEILNIGRSKYSISGRLFYRDSYPPSLGPLQGTYCLPTSTSTAAASVVSSSRSKGNDDDNQFVVSINCRFCHATLLLYSKENEVSTTHSYSGADESHDVFRKMHVSPLPEGYFDQVMYDCICCENPSSSFPLSLAELTTPHGSLLVSSYQLAINAADIRIEALAWETKTTASLLDLLATAGSIVGDDGNSSPPSITLMSDGKTIHCRRCHSLLGDSNDMDTVALHPTDAQATTDNIIRDEKELRLLRHCVSIEIKDTNIEKVVDNSNNNIYTTRSDTCHTINKEEPSNKKLNVNASIANMLSNLTTEQVISRILLQLRDTGNCYSFHLFVPHCDRWNIALKLLTSDYHVYIPSSEKYDFNDDCFSSTSSSSSSLKQDTLMEDYKAIRCCFSFTTTTTTSKVVDNNLKEKESYAKKERLLPIPLSLYEIMTIHQKLLIRSQATVEKCPFKNYSLSYLRY